MTSEEIANKIKESGLFNVEIALALGVTEETVSRWKNGKVKITPTVEYAVSALLNDTDRIKEIRENRRRRRINARYSKNR